jgi:tetratricopeptide (TPR) repeat protein
VKHRAAIAILGLPFFLILVFALLIVANMWKKEVSLSPFPLLLASPTRPRVSTHSPSASLPGRTIQPDAASAPSLVDPPNASPDNFLPNVTITRFDGPSPGEILAAQAAFDSFYNEVSLLARQGKESEAIKMLNQRIESHPKDLNAYNLLGTLYYQKDQLPDAILAWKKVIDADPANKVVLANLEKATREMEVHSGFTHEMTRHFTIKFEGAENRYLYQTVLGILEEAYGEVGRALRFYPDQEVIVFLYTNQQFFDVTRAPAWSGGIFDGKIRLPSKGFENQMDRLRATLVHEYVHAVVHQMTHQEAGVGKGGVDVPTWLHEGIAQYLESVRDINSVNSRLKLGMKGGELWAALPLLHGSFMGFNNIQAAIAYDESLSAVAFLVDEFGIWRLKMLLEELARQGNMDEAMRSALLISYDQFQSRWHASLE